MAKVHATAKAIKTPPKFNTDSVRSQVFNKVAKAAQKGVNADTIKGYEGGSAALAYLKRNGHVTIKDEA